MTDYQSFHEKMRAALPIGKKLDNPGGGTSEIQSFTHSHIVYKRGNSKIRVSLRDLFAVYEMYAGKTVSSSDLHKYAPQVFDSKQSGHSCNCTFFFMALEEMGIINGIRGNGKRGDPFWTRIPL